MVQQVVNWFTEVLQPPPRLDAVARVDRPATVAAEAWVQRVDKSLGIVAVAVLLLAIVHYAVALGDSRAAIADFYPLNGDFQNFNPVKRMFLGEQPGRDFDSYLGLGPACLLYLAMLPLGSDFTSSLFATHFLHAIATAAAIVFLCRLCRLSWGWSCLLGWFVLVYATTPAFLPIDNILRLSLSELAQPGNSSLGLRCLPPLLAAAAMLWVLRRFAAGRSQDVRRAGLCLGTIGGTLLPWSNDHGLSTAMALLLVGGPWLVWRAGTRVRAMQAVALMLAAIGLTASVVLLVASGGSPDEWYRYNFLNVARDQFWYFIGSKITTVYDIPLYRGVLIAVACLGWLTWKIRRAGGSAEYVVLAFLILSNLLAGYISVSGAVGERYFFPLYRCLIIVAPCLAWSGVSRALRRRHATAIREAIERHGRGLAAATAGALVVCGMLTSQAGYQERHQRKETASRSLEVPELGGMLSHEFGKVIAVGHEIRARADAAGVPDKQRLFSTYASAMDVVAGARHVARSDYIIHALGPQRRTDYAERFASARPMFVTTIRDDFTFWEQWVRAVNWDFYAELLKNYRPTDRTLYNVVWERRNEPIVWPDISLETTIIQAADSDVQLAIHFPQTAESGSNERHVVEVEIEYEWQWKPGRVLRGALRPYLFARDEARPRGWGLPHYESRSRFPVELAPGETRVVSLSCQPVKSTRLFVHSCTARVLLPKSQIDGFPLSRLRASSLCDTNWSNGVWIQDSRAAFFVADSTDLLSLQPGSRLRFRAAGERVVAGLSGDQVWLQGPPLDPIADGYPHAIEILR